MNKCFSILLFVSLISGISCNPDKPPPRQFFIEKEKLVPVLVDMHMLYSIQATSQFQKLAREYDSVDTYTYVFDKHDITRAAFDSTIAYYSRHPVKMNHIYDEVIMQLSMLEDSLMNR